MKRLEDIPYETEFYWEGERYRQFLRPKHPKGKFTVICYLAKSMDSERVDMPSGRLIKPVVRVVWNTALVEEKVWQVSDQQWKQ